MELVKFSPTIVIETWAGKIYYIPKAQYGILLNALQDKGFALLGTSGHGISSSDIRATYPIDEKNSVDVAMMGYNEDIRSRIVTRRREMKESIGRDFINSQELHLFVEYLLHGEEIEKEKIKKEEEERKNKEKERSELLEKYSLLPQDEKKKILEIAIEKLPEIARINPESFLTKKLIEGNIVDYLKNS